MKLVGKTPNAMGYANSAVLMALFDHLLANGIIRPVDARNILQKAAESMAHQTSTASVGEAVSIIWSEMVPRFDK